jgi:hypothetical protein
MSNLRSTLAERIKVCPNCKHFIFKDDTVDFCVSCFHQIEPDLDIEIVEKPEIEDLSWFRYLLSWITH